VIVAGRGCAVGSLYLTALASLETMMKRHVGYLSCFYEWWTIGGASRSIYHLVRKQSGDWWNWELKRRTSQIIDEFSPVYLGRCSLPG
jgi:hypothetical protein